MSRAHGAHPPAAHGTGPAWRFGLAPMCGVIRTLTILLLLVPPGLLVLGSWSGGPEGSVLVGTGAFVALLYLGIWLYSRPTRFEVTPQELRLVWPIRSRRIPRSDIRAVRTLERRALRSEFGWGGRIGAGGLWGAFGWLWTSRAGLLDLYISRVDVWVLVERVSARPLLLTPEHPERFIEALG